MNDPKEGAGPHNPADNEHVERDLAAIREDEAKLARDEAKVAEDRRKLHGDIEKLEHDVERPHKIHFEVDAERYETEKRELTPDEIIRDFAKLAPATHYLVQITGGERISYKDKGHEPIKMHDGMKFQVISTGPTPVSDGTIKTGVAAFVDGLRMAGREPTVLNSTGGHVFFPYRVQSGRFAGQEVRLGFIVPPDFPLSPPGGPQVSPMIHPLKSDGLHPTGRIHQGDPEFAQKAGGEWQYWSRPYPNWNTTAKTVEAYLTHIWHLWDSQ